MQEAVDRAVPLAGHHRRPVLPLPSRDTDAYQWKLLAAMRNQFGGHALHAEEGPADPPDD